MVVVALSPKFPQEFVHLVTAVSPRIRVARLTAGGVPPEAASAEVLAAWDLRREELAALAPSLPRLTWVQSPVAGVGDQRLHEVLPAGVAISSAAGVYADLVAEHAMMMMLALYRRLPELLAWQREEHWGELEARTLAGQTLGIVGAGGIGRGAARMAHAFGMRSLGVRRDSRPIEGVDQTVPRGDLKTLLAASDVVLLATPLTPETRGMVDREFLRGMRNTAILINVARGKIVVTDDLVYALRQGEIAGAGLDVTDPEPLPKDHPLWHLPGVIVTPHHANPEALSHEYAVRRLCENLHRYLRGDPLIAVVDSRRGY